MACKADRPFVTHPQPHPYDRPVRLLFVFSWLKGGAEEREMCLLAQTLAHDRYRIDVLVCAHLPGVSDQAQRDLEAFGIAVDCNACDLSLKDRIRYIQRKITGCEILLSCGAVEELDTALGRLGHQPPLIFFGRVGMDDYPQYGRHVTRLVLSSGKAMERDGAQATGLDGRVCTFPPMVDMSEFELIRRTAVRSLLGISAAALVIGLSCRTEDSELATYLRAAQAVHETHPTARFVLAIDGKGPSPGDVDALATLIEAMGLTDVFTPAGNRATVRDVLCAVDIFLCRPEDEFSAQLFAEAGAARLPIIVSTDGMDETIELIRDGKTALLVPCDDPADLCAKIEILASDPALRRRLGNALYEEVAATRSIEAVARQWEAMFDALQAASVAAPASLFKSFMQGGFEASTQKLLTGRRIDVIDATGHDVHAESDYRQLAGMGLHTVRDGVRWHLIERCAGKYDFASFAPMLVASQQSGTQVIWDLMHYGWPEEIDIWSPFFVDRFAAFARETARHWREATDEVPFWCPVNEISFWAWAGGDVRYLNPFAEGRGFELKVQLARASIAAMHALRDVDARARFVHCEPVITIHHNPGLDVPRHIADDLHDAQFQTFELLTGQTWPQIGGDPSLLDIIGLNYYPRNQWLHKGSSIDVDHQDYRPFSDLLFETYARFQRPIFVAETGVEDHRRAPWLRYIANEVARARKRGVPVEGLCLYPVLNHPGWDDDRACQNGLLSEEFIGGERGVDLALAEVLRDLVKSGSLLS